MARLVEILARELGEWPEYWIYVTQDADGETSAFSEPGFSYRNGYWSGHHQYIAGSLIKCTLATDHATAIVTREMWEAERNRIAEPAAWNGEGLPPVGALIEWIDDGFSIEAEVVGSYRGSVVAVDPICPRDVYIGKRPMYRPLDQRTDREKWIDAADAAICHGLSVIDKLGAIYDAGLAKLPEGEE